MKEQPKFKIGDLVIDDNDDVGKVINYQWKEHLDMYVYLVKYWGYPESTRELRENELEIL